MTEWKRGGKPGDSSDLLDFSGGSERRLGRGRRALVPVAWLAAAGAGLEDALRRGRADLVNRQVFVDIIRSHACVHLPC
jgi:hypothetical protein